MTDLIFKLSTSRSSMKLGILSNVCFQCLPSFSEIRFFIYPLFLEIMVPDGMVGV